MDLLLKIFLVVFPLASQSRVLSSNTRQARLSLAEPIPSYYYTNIDGHPGTYAFGYDVQDPWSGNTQFRSEERYPNGTVVGSYGYVDSNGRPQTYRYVADHRGYRVMNDLPRNPVIQSPVFVPHAESSVTWSRPRRPDKQKINKNYLTRIPINRGNLFNQNVLLPPSYYAYDE